MERKDGKKKTKKWWIIGGIVVVLVLAAGAFVGGMWMVGQETGAADPMDTETYTAGLVDLEETPNQPPTLAGAVKSIEGNSIFVSTFASTGAMGHGPGASMQEGPTVEAVVGRDTAVLADLTALDFDFSDPEGGMSEGMTEFGNAARVIEPGNLEDLEPSTMIYVWGERTGDRINADAVVYVVMPFSMGDHMPGQ